MKIYLSAVENNYQAYKEVVRLKGKTLFNLISYYYADIEKAESVKKTSESVLVDSGAHSLQKNSKVDYDTYTERYCEFIQQYDDKNVVGYFEMDVDNIIGYDRVLYLRKKLERVTDKIIPVWHRNRGIEDYKKMCQEYAGRWIAITGFKNEDIRDEQYLMFLKYAKKFDCKVHCLGMTRMKILDKIPFDSVDSSSWVQQSIHGRCKGGQVSKDFKDYTTIMVHNYLDYMRIQEKFYSKWRNV